MQSVFNTMIEVFSTYVEVILILVGEKLIENSFLHVCGGDPRVHDGFAWDVKFSPRMWR